MRRLRLGVAGLGRAFMLMLPALAHHRRVELVAAFDPRREARDRFVQDFGGTAHEGFEALCADPAVEAIYLATPHQFHAGQAVAAARHGRHVLCEKPMAVTLEEANAMVAAARAAGTRLLVGHSHGQDGPILHARRLIASGRYGAVRMVTALNATDFLYRPRRREELVTAEGGGVVFSQGAHQLDIIRLLGGGMLRSLRAQALAWDPARPTEGAYAAFLQFESGAAATATYSGHGRFDSDEFLGWVGELGARKDPGAYGTARAALSGAATPEEEEALKRGRAYGAPGSAPGLPPAAPPAFHNQFGFVLASCEGADLRPTAEGVVIHADDRRWLEPTPLPPLPRAEVLDEFCAAVLDGAAPTHDGAWGLATLEACLALLRSSREGREVMLHHQVATRD
ncbi:Gfo/Idh/MocA family oxidoreductase [Falsiroseomonas sp. CW058]|uniref:Gfo/Idh/MocA family oxidoreductase n=1 Tax=Falsiroseomonas sp. CW058 TaxID=3388664 RepID=UPI003D3108DB